MTTNEILTDVQQRQANLEIIRKLESEVADGLHDDNILIELVLQYQRDIQQLIDENEKLREGR